MIKKRKSLVTLISIMMAMALVLASCGGTTTPTAPSSGTETTEPVPSATTEPVPSATTEPVPSSTTEPVPSSTTEPVEMAFMYLDPSWLPVKWGEDPVTKVITEKTGVKLNCSAPSGEGEQIATVMLFAGDYPELLSGYSSAMYEKYVAAGAFYSLDELVEKYNYPQVLDGTTIPLAAQAVHRSADGKLYCAPEWFSEDGFGSVGQELQVRNDIYQDLGEPEIKTMDDFYKALETVRDAKLTYQGVKMWPLAVHWMDKAILGDIANIYGSNIYLDRYYNETNKKVEMFLRAPELVKAVEFLNKCYNNGLVDPECFTFDITQMNEAYAQGKYVYTLTWLWNLWTADSALMQADPNQYYKALELPQGTPGVKQKFGYTQTAGGKGFSITKNCKDPEAAIRFMNYCLSDEGEILDFYGVEGITMEYKDGVPFLLPGVQEKKLADWAGYGAETGLRLWDRMKSQKWNWERQTEAPIRATNRAMAAKYAFDGTYLMVLQLDATKPEGILYADIQTNIIPQLTQIITDKDSSKVESSIKALLATYEKKGLAALEDAWTVQYDKMVSRK